MRKYSFEKLEVWRLAKAFVIDIYRLLKKFPNSEKFGIVDQLRRASVSVPTNLAEGSARNTGKDKAHFTQISYASLMECLNLLIISRDLDYITNKDLRKLRNNIETITRKLSNLRRSQLNS